MTKNKKSVSVLITSALAVCMLFIMLSAWLIADTLNESRQQGIEMCIRDRFYGENYQSAEKRVQQIQKTMAFDKMCIRDSNGSFLYEYDDGQSADC